MKIILLTQDKQAMVDDQDAEEIDSHVWHYAKVGYAATHINGKIVYMHRLIMYAKKGQEIDHMNGNKLDNQKSNLRFCNRSQNNMNRGISKANTSGYRGVYYIKTGKRLKRWVAQVIYDTDRKKIIGYFLTPQEAAKAWNNEVIMRHGNFAKLNKV